MLLNNWTTPWVSVAIIHAPAWLSMAFWKFSALVVSCCVFSNASNVSFNIFVRSSIFFSNSALRRLVCSANCSTWFFCSLSKSSFCLRTAISIMNAITNSWLSFLKWLKLISTGKTESSFRFANNSLAAPITLLVGCSLKFVRWAMCATLFPCGISNSTGFPITSSFW